MMNKATFSDWYSSFRVNQYVKNLLIFVPLFLAHSFSWAITGQAAFAFVCFCLLTSSVYLLNDVMDAPHDRLHPTKKFRSIARGAILPNPALVVAAILLVIACLGFSHLPRAVQYYAGLYYFLTLIYTFYFKRVAILDVIILSTLYTLRILVGSAFVDLGTSNWLILFSMFFFTSLVFVKRFSQLSHPHGTTTYQHANQQLLSVFGVVSGYLSVLIFALYVNSEDSSYLYNHHERLYYICPVLFYWISYLWLKTNNKDMLEDPVIYAVRDKTSLFAGILVILICIFALN